MNHAKLWMGEALGRKGQNGSKLCCPPGLSLRTVSWVALMTVSGILLGGMEFWRMEGAIAQIVPDGTLGAESSRVTPNVRVRGGRADRIEGGAERGGALFHSFDQFNVSEAQRVYFSNPAGIEAILSRVTGTDGSDILGTLGVDGTADLFFLNPNGIIFGENARLDVAGSFVATTAEGFTFPDGSTFSAVNPDGPPLLTVAVTPGLQYGTAATGEIRNEGVLTAGQDLTLDAYILDLRGQIGAGGDLTLWALDTVRIRDDVQSPFIALAQGTLRVQGDRTVDIVALSHPDSGLFAGGDLVLQSATPINGDAKYWSGGSFRVEQLDTSPGAWGSEEDPVIRAAGDVRFDSYLGASLHILAGGSVTVDGTITITSPDATEGLTEQITLSNGEGLQIAGNQQPTVDIRAGVRPDALGLPLGLTGAGGFFINSAFLPLPPTIGNTPTGADIDVNAIAMFGAGAAAGLVYLSNQYEPERSLPGGDIRVGNILTDVSIAGFVGNSGEVVVDSRGDLTIDGAIATTNVLPDPSAFAGNITLFTQGDLTTGDASTISSSGIGNGRSGTITIDAGGQLVMGTGSILSSNSLVQGNAGDVRIQASDIVLSPNAAIATATLGEGNAGDLILETGTLDMAAASFLTTSSPGADSFGNPTNTGAAGDLTIQADQVNLRDGAFLSVLSLGDADAGMVSIDTTGDVILSNSAAIAATSLGTGAGGDVVIDANALTLENGSAIATIAIGSGDAGNVDVTAREGVTVRERGSAIATSSLGAGNGGTLSINAGTLTIQDGAGILTSTFDAQTFDPTLILFPPNLLPAVTDALDGTDTPTTSQGNSGALTVDARDAITVSQEGFIATAAGGAASGGALTLRAPVVTVESATIRTSATDTGNAGALTIEESQQITVDGGLVAAETVAGGTGRGGDIRLSTDRLRVANGGEVSSSTFGAGDAGNLQIIATESVLAEGTSPGRSPSFIVAQVNPDATGAGGNLTITTPHLTVRDGAQISTSTTGRGNAGNLTIDATESTVLQGEGPWGDNGEPPLFPGGIFAQVNVVPDGRFGTGNGGDLTLDTGRLVIQDGSKFQVSTFGAGDAGELRIRARTIELTETPPTNADDPTTDNFFSTGIFAEVADVFDTGITNPQQPLVPATGQGGDVRITTDSLSIQGGAQLSVSTAGVGDAGELTVRARDDIRLSGISETFGPSLIGAQVGLSGTGQGGAIALRTGNLTVDNTARIAASTFGNGNAGDLDIRARDSITLSNGSLIEARVGDTSTGRGGTLQLSAPRITLTQGAELAVNSQGEGRSGDLDVTTSTLTLTRSQITAETRQSRGGTIRLNLDDRLRLTQGSQITAATEDGQGGQVLINAGQAPVDTITLTGQSRIATEARGTGNGDRLVINSRQLSLTDQSDISASTTVGVGGDVILQGLDTLSLDTQSTIRASTETGSAGSLQITALEAIALTNTSTLSVEATPLPTSSPPASPPPSAGNLTLRTPTLTVSDGSSITVSSPAGEAGNLSITAQTIQLDNGALTAVTGMSGREDSAVITLDGLSLLTLQNGSLISAEALNQANGGNITITTDDGFVIGVPNQDSDIIARASEGQGGNITITARSILGLEERIAVPGNGTNDIDASSQFGAPGIVILNQPDVDPSRGTAVLPSTPVDASQQIAQACPSGADSDSLGSFVVIGRGGIPPSPNDVLSTDNTAIGWMLPDDETVASASLAVNESTTPPLVEAQGWHVDMDGTVMLTASQASTPYLQPGNLNTCES